MRGFLLLLLLPLFTACAGESVRPGINDAYYDQPSVAMWEGRFEVESREIWTQRERIVDEVEVFRGAAIADVGCGTGFMSRLFAGRVGPLGHVYAVDLMPYFVDHVSRFAAREGLGNLTAIQCTERSVALPPSSVDIVFICDTYHHFEYPSDSLRSIRRALRPGGRLVVVDFIRIPGVSRPFVLGHVRAGEEVFTAEIEAAGFEKVGEDRFLEENYMLHFRRRE